MRSSFFIFSSFLMLILLISFSNTLPSLSSERVEYTLGEKIRLDIGPIGEYSLIIETPSGKYLQKSDTEQFIFKPEEVGEYSITIESSEETYEIYFSIIASGEIIQAPLEEDETLVFEENVEESLETANFNRLEVIGEVVAGEPVVFGIALEGEGKEMEINVPKEARDISVLADNSPIDFEIQESLLKKVTNLFSEVPEKSLVIEPTKEVVEVEYTMPGPEVLEEKLTLNKKQVVVSSEIHYENIFASTVLPKETNKLNAIKVYWKENETYLDFEAIDTDGNSLYDSIEWVIPHLSEQTFEIIIEITDAIHFDSNGEEIANIYELMKEIDGNGTTVSSGEFIRVTFEVPLASWNDITIYAYGDSEAIVEVYEANGTEKITEFSDLTEEGLYKKLLLGYSGSSNSFDLRVTLGNVWFDYIVDPASSYQISTDAENVATGTDAGLPTAGKNLIRLSNGNLVAYWEDAGDDPSCALSSNNGVTWPTTSAENGAYADMAMATNGTSIVYVGFETADNDIMYIIRNTNTCDISSGTFADVSTSTNDHFLPDVTFDGNHNYFVLCAFDNDDDDMEVAYTTVAPTLSWTVNTAVGGARTFQGCSIDANNAGNVFIALDDSGNTDIRVLNSSAGTFASNTEVTAFTSAVSNVHLSIRDYEILITGIDGNSDLVVLNSSNNGTSYTSNILAGTFLEAEGCIDPFGRYHFAVVENTASDAIMYVQNYNGTFSDIFTFVDNANDLRYPSVRCTNFPSGNRMDTDRLEIVYTDTSNSDVYFANFSGWVNNSVFGNPNVTINSPTNTTYVVSSIDFNVTTSEYSNCNYSITGGSNLTMTANSTNTGFNYTNSSVPDGIYTAGFYCADAAGNVNYSQSVVFTKDTAAPVVNITYPFNTTYTSAPTVLNYTISDLSPSSCWYSTNGGTTNSSHVAAGTNFTGLSPVSGLNTWRVYCNDTIGNLNFSTISFTYDEVRLGLSWLYPTSNLSVIQNQFFNISLNATCLSGTCGVANVSLQSSIPTYVNSTGSTGTSVTFNIGTVGTNRLVVVILGDESTGTSLSGVTVDGKACSLVVVADNPSTGNHQEMWYCDEDNLGSSNGSVTISATGGDAGWGIQTHLYTGVSQSGPRSYAVNQSAVSQSTISVSGINVSQNGLVIAGWGEGTDGLTMSSQTSPLTLRLSGNTVDPSSADLFTSSGVENRTQTSKTYVATLSGAYNRATGIVASWDGVLSTLSGARPLYTNGTNPQSTSSLSAGQSATITFWVNATGAVGSVFPFWSFGNLTSNLSISNITSTWNITIIQEVTSPEILINSPVNASTFADVTPLLNISLTESASAVWYSINGTTNRTICISSCAAGDYNLYLYLNESSYSLVVYANNSLGQVFLNSSSFTVDMNYNYFDTFTDNSSIQTILGNGVSWRSGNVTFITPRSNFSDGFESGTANWQALGGWDVVSTRFNSGASAIRANDGNEGDLTSDDIDMRNKTLVNVTFWYNEDDMEDGDISVYFYDGSSYDLIDSFGADQATEDLWYYKTYSTTDPQYFISNFRVRFTAAAGPGENVWIDDMEIISNSIANYSVYSVNVSEPIVEVTNVSWSSSGTDSNNYFVIQISPDGGSNWYNATNNQGLTGTATGSQLIYRTLFSSNSSSESDPSILDINISWSSSSSPAPNIFINSPFTSSITDVSPTLNVTIDGSATSLWYNVNNGANITLCTDCIAGTYTTYLYLYEQNYTVRVYSSNVLNDQKTNSTTFQIETNYNHYENYLDNSSLLGGTINNVSWTSGNVSFSAYVLEDDFEDNSYIDNSPTNWTQVSDSGTCVWTIITGIMTESSNCGDASRDGTAFGGYIYPNNKTWTNFNFTTMIRATDNDGTGVMFRIVNNSNYYRVRFEGTSNYRRLERIQAGAVTILDSDSLADGGLTEDQWFILSVVAIGDSITVYLNGTNVLSATDSTFSDGNVALYSWSQDSGSFGADFESVRVIDLLSNGNFTAYKVNVSESIYSIENVTWNSYGTDSVSNNITVQVSANGGSSWVNATNGQGISTFTPGSSLFYRVLFYSNKTSNISFSNLNITWSDVEPPTVNISINSPANGSTLADVTPTLNITINGDANTVWYNVNDGTNYTICTSCNDTITYYMLLREGNFNLSVFANNSVGVVRKNSSNFTVALNNNYYDNFDDNSSLLSNQMNRVTWSVGNVTFFSYVSNAFTDGFESGTGNWQTTSGWDIVSSPTPLVGNGAFRTNDGNEGDLITDDINTTNWTLINLTFWYLEDEMEDADLGVYFYDGTGYDLIENIGADNTPDNGWYYKTYTTQDSQYFISNFRVRFLSSPDDVTELALIDEFNITDEARANFTAYTINVTNAITLINNISWGSFGTSTMEELELEVSLNGGSTWLNTTNGQGLSGFTPNTQLLYRALYSAKNYSDMSLLDVNISWSAAPSVNIIYPVAAIYPTFVTQLNYSATAGGGSPTACWWTNNSGVTNYTITCGQNITTTSIEGVNNWTVYANDSTGAIGYDSVSFSVDASAPQIIFINQTNEDGVNVTSSNPLEQGSVLNLLIEVIDSAVDQVWVTFWEGISGGVEKVKVFFTYVAASGWWVANVTTSFDWTNTTYNYTIYANDTGNLTSTYEGNFSLLKLNSTISVSPNPSPGSGSTNIYGYLQFSNGTYPPNRSINIWFDGNLLWFENLTAIGNYDSNQSIIDTSSLDFGDGTFYGTTESNGNVTLSSGNYSGNYTKIMDAGALVDWNSLYWNSYGQSCNATVLWQEGVDGFSGTYDSYVDGGSPNTNFGTSDTLYADTSPTQRAVLMFDVFGTGGKRIPYNSTITNANITVNVLDAGDTISVYQILENWTEDQVTYNNRLTGTAWSSTGIANTPSRSASTESSFTPSSTGTYTFSVLSAVRAWANQSSSNLGVVLSPGGSNTVGISSSEATEESDRPILAVTFNSTDCTNIVMYARLSNDQNTWTSWQQITNGSLISDSGNKYRYLQYRAEFGAVNTSLSPVLEMVSANYTAIVTNASGFYSYNMTSPTSFGTYTFLINSSIRTMFTNASTTLSVQSGVAPNVTLISPPNVSWVNSSNFNMTYNVSDLNGDVINAILYLNGAPNVSNSTAIVNNGYNNFSVSLPSGTYNWTVNATDSSGLSSMPTNWTVYVDLENPIVSLVFPPNATSFSASSTNLSFNVTDNMDSNLTCSVTLDSNVIHSGVFVNNATNVNYSSGALTTGTHFWNVTCIDESYRSHTSSTFQFTITDTPPAVYLFQPANNYLNNDGDITFYFNVSDDLGINNCSLVLNQTTFIGNQSAVSYDLTLNEITVLSLGQGNYNWTVECYDSNLNYFRNLSYRNFTVDLFAPTIDLNLPSNTSVLAQSNVNFNFTVNDSIDSSLSCNLTVNSLVVDSFTATNGTLTNRLINGLYDGLNYWNVTCIDDALNTNTSLTRVITVQEPPTVFVNTTNETYFSGGFVSIDYTPVDNTNLSSCSIYINGVLNNSNASQILNGQLNEIEIFGLQDGAYNYYINCSDYVPLTTNSSTYRFYMDSSAPTVNLSSPNNETVFATNITFNFTVIDFVDSSLTCNLTVDSTVVDSNFEATNNTLMSRSIAGILDGFHTWYVNCTDGALNVGNSQIFNFTRSTAPHVELIEPYSGQWLNYSPFNLTYYLEDDEGFSISYLILNGSANRSNSTPIFSGQNNTFNISNLDDGFYNWTIIATDLGGQNGTNTTRTFYLDRQAPRPILYHPAHLQLMTTNNITMNYSVTDNLDSATQCQLYLDDSPETITNITNGTIRTEFQLIPDGNHTWYLYCIDEAGNSNLSETRNFTVIAPPNVTLVAPANNYRTTQQTLNFTYLPQDAIGINECSIYLDGILNQTSSSISANQNNNFTIIGIQEGLHNWTVNCTDPDGNTDQPSVRNFYVDLTPPTIVLNAPAQGASLDVNSNVLFNWTATDALDALLQCDLIVNGTVEENNVFVTSGVAYSTSISGINVGNNSWNVTCWDQVLNTNLSETRWFNYTYPDFSINSSGISFSDLTPKENDTVTINATIFNLGYVNATNIVVRFYRGDPDASGVQIGQNRTINITAGNFNITSIQWNATIGTSSIYVVVDPPISTNGSYDELNESNNKAFQNVSISSWHFFYGDLTQSSEFVLADTTEERLVSWLQGNSTEANIYVTDYDSNVYWTRLQALAKTNASVNTTGDFAELDVALNMTGFVDSVNRTYFGTGTFNATDTFIVFSRTINEVPLAYSITDADFTTGILWDTNDTIGDNEYDSTDREDIVFVTKVIQDTAGTYGQADYELRVPALLRNYKTTNTQTAAFYLELR